MAEGACSRGRATLLTQPGGNFHLHYPSSFPPVPLSQPDDSCEEKSTAGLREAAATEISNERSIPEYDASRKPSGYNPAGMQFPAAVLSDASCESPLTPTEVAWPAFSVANLPAIAQFDFLSEPIFNFENVNHLNATAELEMNAQPSPPCTPGCSSLLTPAPSPCNSSFDVNSHPLLPQLYRSFHDESGLVATGREGTSCVLTDKKNDLDAFMESAVWLVAEQQIRYADFLHALNESTLLLSDSFAQQLQHDTLLPHAVLTVSASSGHLTETIANAALTSDSSCSSCNYNQDNETPIKKEDSCTKQKTKRLHAKLPQKATDILKKWLFEHVHNPYPDEDEKEQLSLLTDLTLTQVSNWFINARRRVLHVNQPGT